MLSEGRKKRGVGGRTSMIRKRLAWIAVAAAGLAAGAQAQQSAGGTPASGNLAPVANPVSAAVKAQLPRFSKNMVAAAEAMPAGKYSFKPTPEMNSFAHLVMHIAQSNNTLCSKISDTPAPDAKLADSDPKDKLVAALKASFEYRSEEHTPELQSHVNDVCSLRLEK